VSLSKTAGPLTMSSEGQLSGNEMLAPTAKCPKWQIGPCLLGTRWYNF